MHQGSACREPQPPPRAEEPAREGVAGRGEAGGDAGCEAQGLRRARCAAGRSAGTAGAALPRAAGNVQGVCRPGAHKEGLHPTL